MPAPKIKKPIRHQSHAEKTPADFEPIFKSLAASKAIMGIAPKLVGAKLVVDHRHSQAEQAAADFEKLAGGLNAARSLLKNRGQA